MLINILSFLMKELVESEIRKAFIKHMVKHTPVPNDKRCRVDIFIEEASENVLKLMSVEYATLDVKK